MSRKGTLFLSILLIGTSLLVKAQEKGFNSILSFSISPSIPIGSFGSKNAANINSGFAKFGSGAQLSFNHDFSRKFGLCSMIFTSLYPLDNSAILANFQILGGYKFGINTTSWRVGSYTVGAYDLYTLMKNDRGTISFYDRALIGLSSVQSTGISVTGTTVGSTIQIDQPGKNSTGFCYLVGIGLRFNNNKRFSLGYSVDFFSTKMTFDNVTITTNNNGTITNKSISINQQITSLPISVSFGYRLW
jgi:hypothetical protein